MNTIYQHLQLGQLKEAIDLLKKQLLEQPMNFDLRGQYIELLCINKELEKAKKEIDFLSKTQPEIAISTLGFRQLICAEQSRQRFHQGLELPELLHEPSAEDEHFVKLHSSIANNQLENLNESLTPLKKEVKKTSISINEKTADIIRDLDDSLCRYLEILLPNGKFNVVNLSNIKSIELLPAESLIEHHWLRANIDLIDGPSGIVFIPSTYANSDSDKEKLGQITDWAAITNDCVIGRGLKMVLVGENAVPINQLDSNFSS